MSALKLNDKCYPKHNCEYAKTLEKQLEQAELKIMGLESEINHFEPKCRELENQIEKMNWISVKDRLPEYDTPVVTSIINGLKFRDYGIGTYSTEGWSGYNCWSVTHWMPLPESPKD